MTELSDSRDLRRAEVFRLLREGTGDKMMIRRSTAALQKLKQAYALAMEPVPIFSPLFEIAAYRLANVLFRSAKLEIELREVDRLYVQAAGTGDKRGALGPMPLIQRVAVLHRLVALRKPGDPERDQLVGELEAVFAEACRIARSTQRTVNDRAVTATEVQGRLHNLLELAAYFTDLDYEERVSGLDSPYEDLKLGDEWMIVGTGGVSESVRWPEEWARTELADRQAKGGVELFFELGAPKKRRLWNVWTPTGKRERIGSEPLLLLSALCRGVRTEEALFAAVFGDADVSAELRRKVVFNLRRLLQKCLHRNGRELLPEVTSPEPLRLDPGLRIVGMVSIDSLRIGP
jgi:hypothetical protein